ncbi:MAG: hypothetical protein ABR550_06415 [Wenzhouxiangellaceae bacterium]
MIPARAEMQATDWRAQMRSAWRDSAALLTHLGLDPHALGLAAAPAFPIRVPRAFSAAAEFCINIMAVRC